jgi:DNA-directed RNA polymerase subunit RPC12/RpoP
MSEHNNPSNKPYHAPGLECPECGFRIQVTIEMLLKDLAVRCCSCGLELSVDQKKSQPAINALENLYNSIQNVERIKAETKTIKHD